jgi:hypothetical protein
VEGAGTYLVVCRLDVYQLLDLNSKYIVLKSRTLLVVSFRYT